MPTVDEEFKERFGLAVQRPTERNDLLEAIERRKRRRASTRKVGTIAVVGLVLVGTVGGFLALDRTFQRGTEPQVSQTPAPPAIVDNLGLPFPVCRVSSMPLTTTGGIGHAYVFTKASTPGCPKEGEAGFVSVGIDVTGDGVLDATSGPLPDCFIQCEAFAAPDVNMDGVSEVAVSSEGADGYGVSLYALTTSPPSIEPIVFDGEPFQFPWVDVATHATSAGCQTDDIFNPRFELDWTEKGGSLAALVTQQTFEIDGTVATKLGEREYRTIMDEAPMPGTTLCGVPIYGSAADLAVRPGLNVGLGANLCHVSRTVADFNGDGVDDTVYVGSPVRDRVCPPQGSDVPAIAAIDYDGDGLADGQQPLPNCIYCRTFAAIDFNADGASELVILLQASSVLQFAVYESSLAGSERSPGLYPVFVHPGSEQFPEGDPLRFFVGGDEGFSGAIKCENFPDHPVLVVWASDAPVDGGPSAMRDVVMTKLTMGSGGAFAAVDALHQQQPVGDPPLFDGSGEACGVDWYP